MNQCFNPSEILQSFKKILKVYFFPLAAKSDYQDINDPRKRLNLDVSS